MSESRRQEAIALYRRGLRAINPEFLVRQALQPQPNGLRIRFLDREEWIPLVSGARLVVVAVGKAAAPMAEEVYRLLGDRVSRGLIVTKTGFALDTAPYRQLEAAHPVPDAAGVAAAEAVVQQVEHLACADVVLVLVSGGASALLPAPPPGVSLGDKQTLVDLMLRTELDIHQINQVRKAVSLIKGGGLAARAAPARVVGLYLSDVPGDALSSIGSGPTVPEPIDRAAVAELLEQKGLWQRIPQSIRDALAPETPGSDPAVVSVALPATAKSATANAAPMPAESSGPPPTNGLIGANRHLLRAIAKAAEAAGYAVEIDEHPTTGLNPPAVKHLLTAWEQASQAADPNRPFCRVSGGETLVEVTGSGLGGRCQELAAMMLPQLDEGTVFLAAGSDGNDGPTDAAGGVVDRESWLRLQAEQIPYDQLLTNHDTYHLLERSGNLIRVPPTRNNVMDVHLFLRDLLSRGS